MDLIRRTRQVKEDKSQVRSLDQKVSGSFGWTVTVKKKKNLRFLLFFIFANAFDFRQACEITQRLIFLEVIEFLRCKEARR